MNFFPEATDARIATALAEAHKFTKRLEREFIVTQFLALVILATMAFFGIGIKWIVIIGLSLGFGTLGRLLLELTLRFDAWRSYLEIWSNAVGDALDRLENHLAGNTP